MVFSPSPLFKGIACPAGESCTLLCCVFSHQYRPQNTVVQSTQDVQDAAVIRDTQDVEHIERPAKRQKLTYDKLQDKPPSRAEQIRSDLALSRAQKKANIQQNEDSTRAPAKSTALSGKASSSPSTLTKPITPPAATNAGPLCSIPNESRKIDKRTSLSKSKDGKPEGLNPRMLTPAPAGHAKRVIYLQTLHSDMCRLNRELSQSKVAVNDATPMQLKAFVLNKQELIDFALIEEEDVGRSSPTLYNNLIRTKLAAYRKMTHSEWLKKVQITFCTGFIEPLQPTIDPGPSDLQKAITVLDKLTPAYQISLMNKLVIPDLKQLSNHGYIIDPPTDAEIAEAKAGVELARNFELCDRCGTRFQVFPDRDPETGHLTSNGPCHYHWARKSYYSRQKVDAYTGGKDPIYRCCGQGEGTVGCTEHPDHVFKCTSASRLAAVLPFIRTPTNENRRRAPNGAEVTAVVFDCEMGYTTLGLELIRLTAINWHDKQPLLDVLVRPLGAVIDFNTRFSGVKPEHFTNAVTYDKDNNENSQQVVASPAEARALLCEFLSGDKVPLMGHAIDNDLNTTRLCHPAIVDTIVLYPHKRGLPLRLGLKALSKQILGRDIQMGGSEGHDSHEDAVATADLITVKAAELAKTMCAEASLSAGAQPSPGHDSRLKRSWSQLQDAGILHGSEQRLTAAFLER